MREYSLNNKIYIMPNKKLIISGFLFLILFGVFFVLFFRESKVKVVQPEEKTDKIKKVSFLKIGFITDVHCFSKLNSDTGKWEVNWRCSEPMALFAKQMNEQFFPDVVVDGGDLVDGRDKQEKILYPVALKFFDQIQAPSYHLLGNHETRGFFKKEWLGFTGYEKPYYSVDIKDHRLIFLDGNNKILVGETSPDIHSYPGYLDSEQKIWLEELLKNSQDKNILVFIHQPPLEKTLLKGPGDLFIEGENVRKLFSQYGVKAVFSGHIEEMCYIKKDGVEYYALEGVHKNNRQLLKSDQYKDQGVFYEISIDENRQIRVEMFYKQSESGEYTSFVISPETAVCNNQSIQDPERYKEKVTQENLKVDEKDQEEIEEESEEGDINNETE